ncbi:MAG TPA: hypothetical protein VMU12_02920 [Candidatus Paceibacterota bacterium]|nr:hypothetical protein [Candidatus Paceibacterota bacterium]
MRTQAQMGAFEAHMIREMASFPWRALDPVEDASETEAADCGILIGRKRDQTLISQLLTDAKAAFGKGEIVDILQVQGSEPGPRTRSLVLGLQRMVNEGIPALIVDHEEDGRFFATLTVVT